MPCLTELDTPGLVLDRSRLIKNLARMAATVMARGVRFRPHLKTAKCVEVARLATGTTGPITVSTLREAEYFFSHGYGDMLYAVGMAPGKIARASRLLRAGARLVTLVDNVATAQAVSSATGAGVPFRVLIEIDSGEHRSGVQPAAAQILPIAQALGPAFAGISTFAGHSYGARSTEEIAAVARIEADAARSAVALLATEGFRCDIVSVGSSPTALSSVDLTGITEIRAGVYMFWDLFHVGLGTCTIGDLAVSVLAEIIGRPESRAEFLIDAGALALSMDISTSALPPGKQTGYGLVCDVDGCLLPNLKVARVWQEHGLIVSTAPLPAAEFPVGSRVRILPNHVCPTASAHDRYHVVDGDREVAAVWTRANGW